MIKNLIGENMNNDNISIVGIGFMCLDIIRFNEEIKIQLGGTTANVASVLSELSLKVTCFVPQYSDLWNEYFQKEIANRGIDIISFAKSTINTPRVIEVVEHGSSKHKFFTACPKCKRKLNDIVLPSKKQVETNQSYLENANVLFFDRVSEGIKRAVEIARANNAWIFYEPNASRFYKQLLSTAMKVDILKFSEDRIPVSYINMLRTDLEMSATKLIIVTLGNRGIKYSYKEKTNKFTEWQYIEANYTQDIVDTCGAGDWLTAAFLFFFLPHKPHADYVDESELKKALIMAQKMATFACGFIGAQEIFYKEDIINRFNMTFDQQLKFKELIAQKPVKDLCEYCNSIEI
jgi:Sugar kinases, ribokinase family